MPVESFFLAVASPASSAIFRTSFSLYHQLGTLHAPIALVIIDLKVCLIFIIINAT